MMTELVPLISLSPSVSLLVIFGPLLDAILEPISPTLEWCTSSAVRSQSDGFFFCWFLGSNRGLLECAKNANTGQRE